MTKEKMSRPWWCYSSYTLDRVNEPIFLSKRSWPPWIDEAFFSWHCLFRWWFLCLKDYSAGYYYWCQGCSTSQWEADHTMTALWKAGAASISFIRSGAVHEILLYVVLILRSVCVILRPSTQYFSTVRLPAAGPTSNRIVCVGCFLSVCLFAFLFLMQYQVAQHRGR